MLVSAVSNDHHDSLLLEQPQFHHLSIEEKHSFEVISNRLFEQLGHSDIQPGFSNLDNDRLHSEHFSIKRKP